MTVANKTGTDAEKQAGASGEKGHIHNDVEPPGFDTAAARAVVVDTLVAGIVAPTPRR